jgi:transcriptional regulator with XRE-family HTH domain
MIAAPASRAGLASVTDESRGQEVKQRRLRHGIKSLREFADKSGISREALTAAENGTASEATYERISAWFDRFEEEVGDDEVPEPGVVEFRIAGNFGVDVIVKGPVANIAELEAAVQRLIQSTQTDR